MRCQACDTENEAGRKFCGECGAALARSCPGCGAPNSPTVKFCGECGSTLTAPAPVEGAAATRTAPASERRLVSVLFADLVGFTALSESRDAEDVRDLLSRYFETCRTLIERYGGTVEKFIGDAVMAVWGTPVANEDDAERAVRAALELTAAVAALGEEVAAPELRARAGVLTGEAAVNLVAQGQGMVAGDLVNTASRIQSAAEPGTVLVGEATRRASEAAIVYEDAGAFELKGKAEPVPLWRAVRVVAATRGAQRASGLEPPFVGRDRELRLIKDAFHVSAEQRRAQLISVVGSAGIGKSRLVWEFFKYIDGLATQVRWHRGRCLAYGEGVTYWALAEMIRTNADILEGEESASAIPKLRTAVERAIPDPDERRWVEPRLASLLGLEAGPSHDRDDLFAAWRRFYERLADEMPTVMVFEDIQWADASLLDFVEYLLEWSRTHPIFVLTLARPEIAEKRTNWASGKRSSTSIYLEPLPGGSMEELLTGLVPGIPDEVREKVLGRAEGVPLYAVETVRMLLDRGLVVEEGDGVYRPAGTIDELEVPETLHGLIAARLDGLAAEERRLAQDAAVVGKTFTKEALAAVTELPEAELEPLLQALVRKEVLTVQADPYSPERGQYVFVGDLIRWVAYETLSKRERSARHLAAAAHLERNFEEEDVVEVVASHLLQAYEATPDAESGRAIRARAEHALRRAGERAASLGAGAEARRYFERSIELAVDARVRASLHERAAEMAWSMGDSDGASEHHERAIELHESVGDSHAAARVTAANAEIRWFAEGSSEAALERIQHAFAVLSKEEPDEALAALAAQVGRYLFFSNRLDEAGTHLELALTLAEGLQLPEVLSQALNTKSLLLRSRGRAQEGLLLIRHALEVALDHDLGAAALRAYNNLIAALGTDNRHEEELAAAKAGVELARRLGNRRWEIQLMACYLNPLFMLGRWDEALEILAEVEQAEDLAGLLSLDQELGLAIPVLLHRGELDHARERVRGMDRFMDSSDQQLRISARTAVAMIRMADEDYAGALDILRPLLDVVFEIGSGTIHDTVLATIESSLAMGDVDGAERLLTRVGEVLPGAVPPLLRAFTVFGGARLAVHRGDGSAAAAGFKQAVGMYRELQTPFWMAVALFRHGEWLASEGRTDDARLYLDEAREVFERLRAHPWLERLDALGASVPAEANR
jgi:class 3 adenylate cyclase/tetratricopeptide (TPR) repeat protein